MQLRLERTFHTMTYSNSMLRALIIVAMLIALMAVALIPRFATFHHWHTHEDAFFHGEERLPLLSAADGYYYLDLARAWAEGTYEEFDSNKNVPHGFERPRSPPLFSVFLASIHQWTGFSIEWVASFYSPIAGVIVSVPIYFLAILLAGNARLPGLKEDHATAGVHIMGVVAVAFALLSPSFVDRSSFAWGDTDPLNLLFTVFAIVFAYGAATAETERARGLYLIGWLVTFILFLWWWDQAPVVAIGIAGLPLAVAFVFLVFQRRRAIPLVVLAASASLVAAAVMHGAATLHPERVLNTVLGKLGYVTFAQADPVFHATGEIVTEQARATLDDLAKGIAGHRLLLAMSAVGFVALLVAVRLYALFLVPLLVLSALSLTGMRFMLFAAPLFGLGMGFLAMLAWHWLQPRRTYAVAFIALIVANVYLLVLLFDRNTTLAIPRTPSQIEGMTKLSQITPEDAVIWAHRWGHGHALKYHSRRGVISDGSYHPNWLNYVQTFPFTATSSRQAANWMNFYVSHGREGLRHAIDLFGEHSSDWASGMAALQDFHAIGPLRASQDERIAHLSATEKNELLSFLFPDQDRPVYVFLDDSWKLTHWFQIGANPLAEVSWREVEYNYLPVTDVYATGDRQWVAGSSPLGRLALNVSSGIVAIDGVEVGSVESLFLRQPNSELQRLSFPDKTGAGLFLNVNISGRVGVLADDRLQRSMMTRLYYHEQDQDEYFDRIHSFMPHYSVWRVTSDVWSRAD